MPHAIYTASIPVFTQMLGGLQTVLRKAEAHATEKKIDPNALLQARLFPDMFPLLRQVQVACDFAKSVSARLAGVEVPKMDDNEQTFADLQTRISAVLAFLASLTDAQLLEQNLADDDRVVAALDDMTGATLIVANADDPDTLHLLVDRRPGQPVLLIGATDLGTGWPVQPRPTRLPASD